MDENEAIFTIEWIIMRIVIIVRSYRKLLLEVNWVIVCLLQSSPPKEGVVAEWMFSRKMEKTGDVKCNKMKEGGWIK